MEERTGLSSAGDVLVEDLYLISSTGTYIFILDYLVELNIYEDIYSNFMSGQILLSDSANLIKNLPIVGEEYLVVKITTPSFPASIQKTFRIFSITNRNLISDTGTQTYVLHFCSNEAFNDSVSSLFKPFSGKIDEIIQELYTDYIETNRNYIVTLNGLVEDSTKTPLVILNPTENNAKFVSPGWSPFQCINWLSKFSKPQEGKSCNYLFWESNKQFYFGNIEKIFELSQDDGSPINIGTYNYSPPGTKDTSDVNGRMFLIEEMEIIKTSDNLINNDSGYLANRFISLDLINKKYDIVDYDHINEFDNYTHLTKKGMDYPLFNRDTLRIPNNNITVYPKHSSLFSNFKDNVNEVIEKIHGNRKSHILELQNLKINITVPGRTDVEVGSVLELKFPDMRPSSEEDKSIGKYDYRYSGKYLITAIRHKITLLKHTMIMEIAKDSLEDKETA